LNAQTKMLAQGIRTFTRWIRWQNRGPDGASVGGVLCRAECVFEFDCLGRCTSTTWKCRSVSVEDFDEQLDKNPSTVRPLMAVIGDRRRGQELLEDAKDDDTRLKFCNLQKTPEGILVLQRLADVIGTELGSTLRGALMFARMQAQRLQNEKGKQ
jgi:hypothetical protein